MMVDTNRVLEYKCPCCNAGLSFHDDTQQLKCDYCDNSFDIETVRAYNAIEEDASTEAFTWDNTAAGNWDDTEEAMLRSFQCPSCGGTILTDETTAATFCPYCDNPAIMPARLSGTYKPDAVIPFRTSKEDAKAAFLQLCKGKPLLPKSFTAEHRLEKITGMYVPFWLYDCQSDYSGSYKATRTHHWSDSRYYYTKTDHFLLRRATTADFAGIPMDASSKMDDSFMESIEPYDYTFLEPFDMAYLSGYFADKFDVPAENGKTRIQERVDQTIRDKLQNTLLGYATVVPTSWHLNVSHSSARYVLLPVWILNTNFRGKRYTFAMNGQTGKMTGTLPSCPKRTAAWFAAVFAAVSTLATLLQMVL